MFSGTLGSSPSESLPWREFSVDAAGKDDFAVAAELWALLEEGGAGAY